MSSEREIEARVRQAAARAAERRHKEVLRQEAQEQPALFRRSELEGQGELFEEELDRLEARGLTLVKLERTYDDQGNGMLELAAAGVYE